MIDRFGLRTLRIKHGAELHFQSRRVIVYPHRFFRVDKGEREFVSRKCTGKLTFLSEECLALLHGLSRGRLDSEYSILREVVTPASASSGTQGIGIKGLKREVTVGHARPSPVKMVETFTVVAVADKGMSPSEGGSSPIHHGADITQILIHHVIPFSGGIILT